MKQKTYRIVLLLCLLSVLLTLMPCAADTPKLIIHTVSDDAPEVDAQTLFLPIYEEACDIRIEGTRVTWTFLYENIFRSTEKWRTFSAKVDVTALSAQDYPTDLANAMASGYLVDFRDGDIYPGTAQVDIRLDDVFGEAIPPLSVYTVEKTADGGIGIRPVADNLKPVDGTLSMTLTEAHDLLILPTEQSTLAKTVFDAYTVIPTVKEAGGFFGGAGVFWIVFFAAIGAGLVILVAYLVTVKVVKKKRRDQKQRNAKS